MNKKSVLFNKKLVIGIIILFVGMSINLSTGSVVNEKSIKPLSNGNTLYVGGTGPNNYTRIQDAIDNASDGDTVFVYSGIYDINEYIIINKSIRLIGESKLNTIIDGIGVDIDAPEVEVTGFTLQNGLGIMISSFYENSGNNSIYDNIFKSNDDFLFMGGMTILNTSYNNIFDNSFINCGLMIGGSYHNSVNNNIINGKPLEYYESTSNKVIEDAGQVILIECQNITLENLELNNSFINLQFIDCFNCKILNSSFSNNGIAGLFINSDKNIFSGNIFSNNYWGLSFGLCKENKITKNSFQNNGFSLLFVNSSCNEITYNNFKYKFRDGINHNIMSTESNNKWFRNFWNRPRLLPLLIWNFEFHKVKYFPIFPTSPDIDWRPAIKPNEIDGADSDYTEPIVLDNNIKISYNSFFNMFLDSFPMLERLLSFSLL